MSIALSLICPVYKVAEFIPDLMNSLLAGVNSSSVEVIFVDDCCPDNSITICEKFLNAHSDDILFKAVVLKQAINQGQAVARNAALKIAKGVYIGFVDSDDVIAPHYWHTLAKYVTQADNDIIEFSFEEFTTVIPSADDTNATELSSSNLNPFNTGFFVWTRLYNKAVIATLSFPKGMIYEDIYFNIHAFAKAKKSIRLSNTLVFYRKREGSTTATRTAQYSQLLINLITGIQQTIADSLHQQQLISLLQHHTLISMLKGLKITSKMERQQYYQLCWPKLSEVNNLALFYGATFKSKSSYLLAKLICYILK
jgi:glycosyltransferase involved in cell wall biosynthesis